MIQRILHSRLFLACLLSATTGMALYFRTPFPEDNIFLRVMAIRSAPAFLFFKYSYTLFPYTKPSSPIRSCFPASTFSPSRQAARFGQANCLSIQTLGKEQNFLSWWARYITPASKSPRKHHAGWSSRNEGFSRASPSWAPSAREKRQAACTPSRSRLSAAQLRVLQLGPRRRLWQVGRRASSKLGLKLRR